MGAVNNPTDTKIKSKQDVMKMDLNVFSGLLYEIQ